MKKLKHQQVEEDWGLVDGELEVLEGREEARTRFLQSDLSWATIGSRQTKIRIWSTLELEARILVIEMSRIACDLVEAKVMEMTTAWLEEDEAAKEFENIPAGWIDDDTNPEGWKPSTGCMEGDNIPDEWKSGEPTGQSDTLPEGWPSTASWMAGVTLTGEPPEDEIQIANLKYILKSKQYTERKKSLLKKQMSDKTILGKTATKH